MITQTDWIDECYAYYIANGIVVGDDAYGKWENAHYPTPKCKEGTHTIPLLREHHAVHGVIQSEEYNYPCIWGWEAEYLDGEWLDLCKKWQAEKARVGVRVWLLNTTPEERSKKSKEVHARVTPEERGERVRRGRANQTPEERSEIARKGRASMTPEERSEIARKGRASMTPEQRLAAAEKASNSLSTKERAEIARKGWETRRRNRQCNGM